MKLRRGVTIGLPAGWPVRSLGAARNEPVPVLENHVPLPNETVPTSVERRRLRGSGAGSANPPPAPPPFYIALFE